MELTPDEERIIKERRQAQEQMKAMAASRLTILRVAYQYELWLQSEDAGSTFSTFCDDFNGYTGPNRKEVFSHAEKLRGLARELPYITVG